jgi:hypothetical protein
LRPDPCLHLPLPDEASRELLTRLVALLLQSAPAGAAKGGGSGGSLKRALLELCQLTGHRLDGLHLEKLEGALEAAAADAGAPGSGSDTERTASSSGGGGGGGGACSSVDEACSRDAGGGEAEFSPATPHPRRGGRLQAMASAPTTAAAAAATPATTARKAPRSRLAAMSAAKTSQPAPATPGGQPAGGAAGSCSGGDDDAAALAGLLAERLTLGEPGAQSRRAPPLARKPVPQRRVRFCGPGEGGSDGEEDGEEDSGAPRAAPAVPASVARHAVRRDQPVAPLQPLALAQRPLPKAAAAARGRSRLGAAAAATAAAAVVNPLAGCEPACGARAWRPAVVLLLDSPLHQFPWESCPGASLQLMYRCAPAGGLGEERHGSPATRSLFPVRGSEPPPHPRRPRPRQVPEPRGRGRGVAAQRGAQRCSLAAGAGPSVRLLPAEP